MGARLAAVAAVATGSSLGTDSPNRALCLKPPCQSQPLRFVYPTDCSTFRSNATLSVNVSIAHGLSSGDCVIVNVRHSKDKVWWFLTPPSPLKDTQHRFCVGSDLQLAGTIPVDPGYVRISAWWSQPKTSKERPPNHAVIFVSILKPGEERSELKHLARQGQEERDGHLLEDPRRNEELSAKYRPLAKHPWLQSATAATVGLLEPRLVRALADGSPHALWSVIEDAEEPIPCEDAAESCTAPVPSLGDRLLRWHGDAPITPPVVYRVPLFTVEAGEMLLQELEAANGSPLAGELTQPQNPDGYGRAPGSPPGAVMLAEVGLGPLVESLVKDVLAPITRLVYPQWGGDAIDSWQSFSIHKYIPDEKQQAAIVWDHVTKADEARMREDFRNLGMNSSEVEAILAGSQARETLYQLAMSTFKEKGWIGTNVDEHFKRICAREDSGHTDICELTVNICLGRNFSRNGVFFGGYSGLHGQDRPPMWVPHVPGTAYVSVCQHQHGVVGPASGDRHSVVIRAMSSQIRGAPAEGFAMRCLA